jgi:hypothetical protein
VIDWNRAKRISDQSSIEYCVHQNRYDSILWAFSTRSRKTTFVLALYIYYSKGEKGKDTRVERDQVEQKEAWKRNRPMHSIQNANQIKNRELRIFFTIMHITHKAKHCRRYYESGFQNEPSKVTPAHVANE